MYEILKTEKFSILLSFLIGFAGVALCIPICKGAECYVKKAPSIEEMKKTTFHLQSKCYQFRPETMECSSGPGEPIIEAFTAWKTPKKNGFTNHTSRVRRIRALGHM
jgi:hypothetical protein|uniref:Uncharacterized protein n=1 Tax=viral metagenome TaxID=1070528 RepID=A0A6C0DRC2_9ZZZZ